MIQKESDEWGNKHEVPTTLSNYYKVVPTRLHKLVLLANYITVHRDEKIIVFFNTCDSVDLYYKVFQQYVHDRNQAFGKFYVGKLHGDMKQAKRLAVYKEFDDQKDGVLFATDVIARGIDFGKVDAIVQVDIPQDPNFYIHRIGRTARKGTEGHALVIVQDSELPYINFLLDKVVTSSDPASNCRI